jgi:hypothetical protein
MNYLYLLFGFFFIPIHMYSVVIVPGFGGSVLYDTQKKIRVWPPYPSIRTSRALDIDCQDVCTSVSPLTTLPLGDVDGIDVGTAISYLLTKNSFYKPLIRKIQTTTKASVFALPYDFRLIFPGSDYFTQWCQDVKHFLETHNERHILVCHSLGGLLIYRFLVTYTSAEWQRKYISRIYFLNVPFGGTPETVYAMLRNVLETPFQIPFHNFIIPSFQYFAGLQWCLPHSSFSSPILRINGEWYTPKDMPTLFQKYDIRLYNRKLLAPCEPLHIPSFVIYGSQLNTTSFMDWDSKVCLYEDGDKVVPRRSLLFCQEFLDPESTFYIEVQGMQHGKITDCFPLITMLGSNSFPMSNMTLHIDQLKTT